MELGSFDLQLLAVQLTKLALAFLLCFPMAWDREQSSRSLGVRTFPLVAVASCAFVLVGQSGQSGLHADENAMSRVLQGIITGVGFLGGGAIVKRGMRVAGAATAAAVWATAALGVAVADGEYGIAVALGIVGFVTLRWLHPLKRMASAGKGDPEAADDALTDDLAGSGPPSREPRRPGRIAPAPRR